ncbi:MAG TPA: HTTM domain-containing protein [Polyangiaceae bacterium]|nr:HTTM domain-containing protein [Polyangiaceae bacterium]
MNPRAESRAGLSRVIESERPTYLLGLVRVAVGVFLLVGTFFAIREVLDHGYFADAFFIPVLPHAAVASRSVYLALLGLRGVASLLIVIGVQARPALLVASSIGLYGLLCDRLEYHNNRYVLELLAFLLAFAPCDRSFVLRKGNGGANGPVWAIWLMKLQISLVYAASAGSKLVDTDWRGGQVLHIRYLHVLDLAAARGKELPNWVHTALSSPFFAELSSKAAIFGELFLAVGLWVARTRPFALWLGVMLHLGIQLAAHVEIFSFLMGAAYVLFARQELGARTLHFDPASLRGARIGAVVQRLDWLKRFTIEPRAGSFEIVERDGTSAHGFDAIVALTRALPLLFPLWLPLAIAARLRGGGVRVAPAARAP